MGDWSTTKDKKLFYSMLKNTGHEVHKETLPTGRHEVHDVVSFVTPKVLCVLRGLLRKTARDVTVSFEVN